MSDSQRSRDGAAATRPQERAICRVAIIEDHVLQRARTESILTAERGFDIVFSGETAPDFVAWLKEVPKARRPHLLILDLMVDRGASVSVALVESLLRAGLKILVVSALASPPLVRSIVHAGVSGIVGKRDSEADVLAAIGAVLSGDVWMSPELAGIIASDASRPALSIQEERALVLYASGLRIADVARSMNISAETAKQYLGRVRAKYTAIGVQAQSQLDLGRIAWSDGYVDPAIPARPSPPDSPRTAT